MASSEKNITSGYNIKNGKVTKKDLHIVETLETKVDKVEGKQLSDENYTLAEKNKLESTEVFTSEEKIKLSNIQTPMQIAGRVDSVDDLPTENVKKGDVYLVGAEGSENFEEYVCVDESTVEPTWEGLGPATFVQKQADWDQNNSEAPDFIKNRIVYSIPEETADVDSEIIDSSVDSYEIDQTYSLTTFTDSYKPAQEDINKTYRVNITDKDGNKICDNKKIKAILTSAPKHNPESTGEPLHVESVCKYDSYYTCDTYSTQITESNLLGATITLTRWDSDTGEPVDTTYTLTNENRAEDSSDDQTDGEEYLWQHVINEEYDYDAWFIYIYDPSGCGLWAEYYNHVPDEPGVPTLNTVYCDSWSSICTVTLSNQVVLDPHRVYINEFIYDIIPDIPVLTDSDLLGMTLHLYDSDSRASFNITLTSDNRADSPDFGYDEENVKNWYFGTSEGVTGLIIRAYNRWEEAFFELTDILSDESNQTPFDINTFYITTHNEYELPIYDFLIGPPEVIYEDQIVLPCVGTEDYHDLYETSMGFSSENGFFVISDLEEYNPSDNLPYTVDIKEITKEEDVYHLNKKYLPLDAQSDWEENDETDFSHIKNRTHWKERGNKEIQYNLNNSTPHETVSIDGSNFDYYPEVVLTENLLLGTIVNIEGEGRYVSMTLTEQNRVYNIGGGDGWYFGDYLGATVFMLSEISVWCSEEVQISGFTFKKGLYVLQSIGDSPITYSIITNTDYIKSDIYHKIDNNYLPGYLPDENLYGYGYKEYQGETPRNIDLNFTLENVTDEDFTFNSGNSSSELIVGDSENLEPSESVVPTGDYTFDMTVKYTPTIISEDKLIGHDIILTTEGSTQTITSITNENINEYVINTTSDDGWLFGNQSPELMFTVTEELLSHLDSLPRYLKTIIESNNNQTGTYLVESNNITIISEQTANIIYTGLSVEFDDTFTAEMIESQQSYQIEGRYVSEYHNPEDFIGTTIRLDDDFEFEITQDNIGQICTYLVNDGSAVCWSLLMVFGCTDAGYEYIQQSGESQEMLSLFSKGSGTYLTDRIIQGQTQHTSSLTLNIDSSFDWKLPYIQKISDVFLPDDLARQSDIDSLDNRLDILEPDVEFVKNNLGEFTVDSISELESNIAEMIPQLYSFVDENGVGTLDLSNNCESVANTLYKSTMFKNETATDIYLLQRSSNVVSILDIPKSTIQDKTTYVTTELFTIDDTKITSVNGMVYTKDDTLWVYGVGTHLLRLQNVSSFDPANIEYIDLGGTQNYVQFSSENSNRFIACGNDSWTVQFMNYDGTISTQAVGKAHYVLSANNRYFFTCQRYGIVYPWTQDWTEHIYTVLVNKVIAMGDWVDAWAYNRGSTPQICNTSVTYNEDLQAYLGFSTMYSPVVYSKDGLTWRNFEDFSDNKLYLYYYDNVLQLYFIKGSWIAKFWWKDTEETELTGILQKSPKTFAGKNISSYTQPIHSFIYNEHIYGIYRTQIVTLEALKLDTIYSTYNTLKTLYYIPTDKKIFSYRKHIEYEGQTYYNNMYTIIQVPELSHIINSSPIEYNIGVDFWYESIPQRITNNIYLTSNDNKLYQAYDNVVAGDGMEVTEFYNETNNGFDYDIHYEIPVEYIKEVFYAQQLSDDDIEDVINSI